MITYKRLWETMEKKNVSQYRLIEYYGISRLQLNRIKNNHNISSHTVNVLCTILNCGVQDIMEFEMDPEMCSHLVGDEPAPFNPFKEPR